VNLLYAGPNREVEKAAINQPNRVINPVIA
jgi:hypothetical protein